MEPDISLLDESRGGGIQYFDKDFTPPNPPPPPNYRRMNGLLETTPNVDSQ